MENTPRTRKALIKARQIAHWVNNGWGWVDADAKYAGLDELTAGDAELAARCQAIINR